MKIGVSQIIQFILLHFANTDEDTSSFLKVSYKQLYHNLRSNKSDDNIFTDYLSLLETIINPTTNNLFYLKKLANNLLNNEEIELSLIDYFTLKKIFDEN